MSLILTSTVTPYIGQEVLYRTKAAQNLKLKFDITVPLTVHWDGKLIEDITTKEYVDRLPVLVSGANTEILLRVLKLSSGTGTSQAEAVIKSLNLRDQVVALSFDTTASNTGHRSGACTLIKQKLEKDVLNLPCRHHIVELIIGAAFEKVTAASTASSGPDIRIFKQFQKQWQCIDHDQFAPASTDISVEAQVAPYRSDLVDFIHKQLQFQQPRNDYKEFLELSLVYLGETPTSGIHFQAPGAIHRARWMTKVIYSIRMWLFRRQFKMTRAELKSIRDMAIFAVKVYLRAWITAPRSIEAPLNDFTLMRALLEYPHTAISAATSHKLGLHLWYLSEELITLALFGSRVSAETKVLIVSAMKEPAPEHPPKSGSISLSGIQRLGTVLHRKFDIHFQASRYTRNISDKRSSYMV